MKLLTRNRNFRLLWLGQLVSALGDRLAQMGVMTYIMVFAHDDGSRMAGVTFCNLLPFLLFGPLFGAMADRYSRKALMLCADILRAVIVLSIPFFWAANHSVVLIMCFVFLLGCLSALFSPAKMSFIADIVARKDFLEANSLVVTTGMIATLVGTFLAGLFIRCAGVTGGFYVNALTYVFSAVFLCRIIAAGGRMSPGVRAHFSSDIKAGIRYVLKHALVARLMILGSVFSAVTAFAYILILHYGSVVLCQGPFGMGALLSCAGCGMIVGSACLAKIKRKVNYDRLLSFSFFFTGLFLCGFLFKPDFCASLFLLFAAGCGEAVVTITMDTLFQKVSPNRLKGKIFAARSLLTNFIFLLSLIVVGALIRFIRVEVLFFLAGSLGLVASFVIFLSQKDWGYHLLRLFLNFIMRFLFSLKVSGLENIPKTKRVILAGNHTSLLDGAVVLCAYKERLHFLVAAELFKKKFFGWCARRLGYIPINRGGFNKEAFKNAVRLLKDGHPIGIFPEGKIIQDGRIAEGKAGVAVIAKLADAQIVPFAIEGAQEAWSSSMAAPRRFPVEVRFGPPIDTGAFPVSGDLADKVMKEILKVKLSLEREGYLAVDPDEIVRHLIGA